MTLYKSQARKGLIFLSILIIAIYSFLFYINWNNFSAGFSKESGLYILSIILALRIFIFAILSLNLFLKWFKQESIYLTDAYFLFALFFTILTFGKIFDLFYFLAYASEKFVFLELILLQIRYIIILLNAIPLLYLGLETIISFINSYWREISRKQFNLLRLIIILFFFSILSSIIIFAQSIEILRNIYPIIVLITLLGIIMLFIFMYKNKRLSQANGLIIGIGFILYVCTSIVRFFLNTLAESFYLIIAEVLDMVVYLVIFYGFITKPKYAN